MSGVNDPYYKIAEHRYWTARRTELQTIQKACTRCNTLDNLAHSRVAGQNLCKRCFIEAHIIYLEYQDKVTAWKKAT